VLPTTNIDICLLFGTFASTLLSTAWLPSAFLTGILVAAFIIVKVTQRYIKEELPLFTEEGLKSLTEEQIKTL